MMLPLRTKFSESARRRGQHVPMLKVRDLCTLSGHHFRHAPTVGYFPRRMPTWAEFVLVVLSVSTLCAGLNYVMLLRTATFLDEQMMHVANSRGSARR